MSGPTRIRPIARAITSSFIEAFAPVASYFTVNISSPNTPGLRNLQQAAVLDDLARVIETRERGKCVKRRCWWRKIAPDLSLDELDDVHVARRRKVDGMVVATTPRPPSLREAKRAEQQGTFGGRCSACRRGCWRRPMCGSRALFLDRRSAASILAARRYDEDSRRCEPDPALLIALVYKGSACRRDQGRPVSVLRRTNRESLSRSSARTPPRSRPKTAM